MTHAINSSTKLLSIDITKRAYSDDKELKTEIKKKRKLKRERKKERKKKINEKIT